ncbi:fimbrillin family protein [uncultured Parabacteroides sp.]|jgi:hypothetical protein|uniref:fimbrillin family protein n=1 Tax=uncultured Parabacteroides sp. TaxID=512312 RepID=UPI0026008099|nr:fimbrillin family protein [uncultured Parabacteroides sp.]
MKTKQFTNVALSLSCCLAALTACVGGETDAFPPEKQPVGISATITGEVTTKADTDYKPENGEKKIYMYYKNGSNTTASEKGVYTYSGSTWNAANQNTQADLCIFWDDLVAQSGKYPFFAVSPKDLANATTGAVETNQSSEPNFTNADLLMAYNEVGTRQAQVPLTFKHMLAKLTIEVKMDVISTINNTSVSVDNAIKDYTVAYTGSGVPSTAAPAIVTATGTTKVSFAPFKDTNKSSGKTVVYSVILPAQDISSTAAKVKTTITVGSENNSYTYAPTTATKLANGTNTTLTLTVNGTVLELSDIKVTDWGKVTASGSITLDK